MKRRIAVAMTCHNRRQTTLDCLDLLFAQVLPPGTILEVFLTDDGSTDGTALAVARKFPRVHLLNGDGTLYWNGGMHLALTLALSEPFDFHFWLNDDVLLFPFALSDMLSTHDAVKKDGNPPIVVGVVRDPSTLVQSYGGQKKSSSWHPFRFKPVGPGGHPCATFQGNAVLVPARVIDKIGIIDTGFCGGQTMGDTDYGLRASACDIPIITSKGFMGDCRPNAMGTPWRNPCLSLARRWQIFWGPKGVQAGHYLHFARRHGGRFWWLFWTSYVLTAIGGLVSVRTFDQRG